MAAVKTSGAIVGLALLVAVSPATTFAQAADEPTMYVAVDCMKSKSPDYASIETEIWQPMHQELVRQGKKGGWSLFWVLYGDRSECDYYTVNTFLGEEQLNDDTPYRDVFEAVHPGKSWDEASARTGASREMVKSELWTLVDAVSIGDHRYARVNQMHVTDGVAYVAMEREIYKPVHQALVDAGHSAGWGVYRLVTPSGTSLPYNYSTVDFGNKLGSIPFAATIRAVHPGMEASAIGQRMEGIRDLVRSDLWMRMATTQQN